jgi:hypothetical protein
MTNESNVPKRKIVDAQTIREYFRKYIAKSVRPILFSVTPKMIEHQERQDAVEELSRIVLPQFVKQRGGGIIPLPPNNAGNYDTRRVALEFIQCCDAVVIYSNGLFDYDGTQAVQMATEYGIPIYQCDCELPDGFVVPDNNGGTGSKGFTNIPNIRDVAVQIREKVRQAPLWYYYTSDNPATYKKVGPLTQTQIRSHAKNGYLLPHMTVENNNGQSGKASSIVGLFSPNTVPVQPNGTPATYREMYKDLNIGDTPNTVKAIDVKQTVDTLIEAAETDLNALANSGVYQHEPTPVTQSVTVPMTVTPKVAPNDTGNPFNTVDPVKKHPTAFKLGKVLGIGCLGVIALLFCVMLIGFASRGGGNSGITASRTIDELYYMDSNETVWSDSLVNQYNDNKVAADNDYKGKLICVYGIVDRIGKDFGKSYVVFQSPKGTLFTTQCFFDKEYEDELLNIKSGMVLSVLGVCDGATGNVLVKGCRVFYATPVSDIKYVTNVKLFMSMYSPSMERFDTLSEEEKENIRAMDKAKYGEKVGN